MRRFLLNQQNFLWLVEDWLKLMPIFELPFLYYAHFFYLKGEKKTSFSLLMIPLYITKKENWHPCQRRVKRFDVEDA